MSFLEDFEELLNIASKKSELLEAIDKEKEEVINYGYKQIKNFLKILLELLNKEVLKIPKIKIDEKYYIYKGGIRDDNISYSVDEFVENIRFKDDFDILNMFFSVISNIILDLDTTHGILFRKRIFIEMISDCLCQNEQKYKELKTLAEKHINLEDLELDEKLQKSIW